MGDRIRFLRKAKGWSQEELGEYAALSYKFIGEIERGTVNPSLDTLLGISNALHVELAKLFSNDQIYVLTKDETSSVQSALDALNAVITKSRSTCE
ncbi:MAG: helix-turn-helix transcriptional regulator [Desulfuromonadaceae bacterium]|nr:helix-turn-helix transcriptional regulator [Desulfuromonadaceae bacterium]